MKNKCSFYKKKAFYIVLIVIFTILLIADVVIGNIASSMNRGFGGNIDFSQMQEMPSGDGIPSMEDVQSGEGNPFGGEMPSGEGNPFGGEMPSGEGNPFGGEMPSGEEFSFDQEGMPSRGEMPSMGGMSSGFRVLQFIGNYWLIIAVVLAVLDGLCIFMLIRTIKKEKKNKTPEIERKQENEYFESDSTPKEYPILNKIKVILSKTKVGVAVLRFFEKIYGGSQRVVAIVLTIVLLFVVITSAMGDTTEVVAQTEASVYSGTVEKGEIVTSVPGTGTITDVEGDDLELPVSVELTERYVSNGDTVSKGDKIAQADLVSVLSAIADVQEVLDELDEELDEHEDDTISERIKSGTDGKVKVIYAKEDVDVLDTMYEYGALMLISLDGMMAVSFETEASLSVGDSVSVTTEDGEVLSGKVQSVTKGEAVITVSDDKTEYDQMVSVSTEDGTVIGTGKLYIHSELKVTGYAGTVSSISVEVNDVVDEGDTLLKLSDTEFLGEYESLLVKRAALEEMMQELLHIYQDQYIYAKADGVILGLDEDGILFRALSAGTSASPVRAAGVSTGLSAVNDSSSEVGTGATEPGEAQQGADEVQTVTENTQPETDSTQTPGTDGTQQPETDDTQTPGTDGTQQPETDGTQQPETDGTQTPGTDAVQQPETDDTQTPGTDGAQQPETDGTQQPGTGSFQQGSGMPSGIDIGSMMQGGSGIASGMDSSNQVMEEENTFEIETASYFSIIPQDKVTIAISVDEMDIRSIKAGQPVEITLDAFPGQSFSGEVSTIDYKGSNSGGSTKYSVVVSMERKENMLAGMNASVAIQIEKAEGLLVIPVDALMEDETGLYVYTTYNEQKQEFGNPTAFTTGISDGEYVEILSGLEDGSSYWYSILDVVNYSTAPSASGGSMFGGGGMPFGGR